NSREIVMKWAKLAVDAGARAIVASPHEVSSLRSALPSEITLITPGVRPEGSHSGDQARVATPKEAVEWGADYVVIGRPITSGASLAEISLNAKRISQSISQQI
ncbi:MAG: orotidine 5'-phosphate decarboxylase / HUMPS family protein, partial [Actinomycetota bacterium]